MVTIMVTTRVTIMVTIIAMVTIVKSMLTTTVTVMTTATMTITGTRISSFTNIMVHKASIENCKIAARTSTPAINNLEYHGSIHHPYATNSIRAPTRATRTNPARRSAASDASHQASWASAATPARSLRRPQTSSSGSAH